MYRRASLGDRDALAALARECFGPSAWSAQQIATALDQTNTLAWVGVNDTGISAFLLAQEAAGEFEIHSLAVAPQHRRRGIAAQLLAAAFPDPAVPLFLEVRAGNAPAVAFYRAHGFRESGRRRDYYHDPQEDALLFQRGRAVREYFLTTERLGFGRWIGADLELALAVWGDPEVTRYVGGPFTPAQVATRLQHEMASQAEHGVQYWPVFARRGGQHLGAAGARVRPAEAGERVYAIGYYLRPEAWGQGYALEAGRAVVAHAFRSLGAGWLFAAHHPRNPVSRVILEKLGFRYTHDELYPPTGLQHHAYRLDRPPFS